MNLVLKEHYENCLAKHGPNHLGIDWPNEKDCEKRFQVMLEVEGFDAEYGRTFLDIGCGIGLFSDTFPINHYVGIDISPLMIVEAKKKFPGYKFQCRDILKKPFKPNRFDHVMMNGLLTVKASNTQEEMWDFARQMILAAFKTARIGIAFNVMSKHVDWERDDLFHVGLDEMAEFLTKEVSRHFVIRADYGLYEYSVYVYKNPQ